MKVTQKTQDWGNSTGIRLPQKSLRAARWSRHQEVSIDIKGRSIVLTPLNNEKQLPQLEDLLQGVTPENVKGEIDWGTDKGKEIIIDD